MVSTLRPSDQQFLNGLNIIIQRASTDQLQIASGVKINQVSDDPDQVSELLQARSSLAMSQQISSNLGNVKSEVDAGEQSLESAVQMFGQVQTVSAPGATGTSTGANRLLFSQQIQSLEQQMVGLANTSVSGRHIFAGDTDQVQPYTYDVTQPDPVSAYQGSTSTRVAQHPDGSTFPIALNAQQIFDSTDPATNVFTTMNNLITALQTNNPTAIQAANSGVSAVGDFLNQQLAFYGETQDTVASATDYASTQQVQLQTQIGNIDDVDTAGTILDMTQAQTQEQAALTSRAQMPTKTLFDYM